MVVPLAVAVRHGCGQKRDSKNQTKYVLNTFPEAGNVNGESGLDRSIDLREIRA